MSSKVIKDVRVEYENAVTVNIGNFQNVRPAYRVSATVQPGVNPSEARALLKALVDKWLEEEVEQIRAEATQ